MKIDKDSVLKTFVAAPFAHVFLSSIFLWGYCLGFGANISSQIGVTDVFSISMAEVGILYFIVFIYTVLLALALVHIHDGAVINASLGRPYKSYKLGAIFWTFSSLIILFAGGIIAVEIYYYFHGHTVIYMKFAILFLSFVAIGVITIGSKIELSKTAMINAIFLFFPVIMMIFFGLHRGQTDRWSDYSSSYGLICKNSKIMRKLSDNYLAKDKFGRTIIVDKSCSVIFEVPAPRFKGRSNISSGMFAF